MDATAGPGKRLSGVRLSRGREAAIAVASVAAYLLAAVWARNWSLPGPVLVWFPPAGVALAVLFFRPRLVVALVLAEAFSTAVIMGRGDEFGPLPLAVNSVGIVGAYALGAWVMRRRGVEPNLRRPRDLLDLALGSVVVAATLATLIGVAVQHWAGVADGESLAVDLAEFWVGDLVGIACLTPALLIAGSMLHGHRAVFSDRPPAGGQWLVLPQLAIPAVVAVAMMSLEHDDPVRFTYLAFVPVILLTVRHGVVTAALSSALATAVMTAGADLMIGDTLDRSDFQLLLFFLTLTGVLTGSIVSARYDLGRLAHRLGEIVESSPDLIATVDEDGAVDYVNPFGRALLGLSGDVTTARAASFFPDELATELARRGARVARDRGVWSGDNRLRRVNGEPLEVSQVIVAHHHRDGTVTYSTVCRDMTRQHLLEEQLRAATLHDDRTGLPNRTLLEEHLDRLADPTDRPSPTALLFLDVDNMGWINERFGFATGDAVFAALADRLRSQARGTDQVFRYGASQFVVVLPDIDDELDAMRFAVRVLDFASRPVRVDQGEVRVTVSIGIALGRTGADHRGPLRSAEIALHRAREDGGSGVALFDESLQVEAQHRIEVELDLQEVLDSGSWWLDYQPVYDVTEGRIVSVEALLRWTHPTRGPVSPFELIRLAESSGAIVDLGREIFRRACQQAQDWQAAGIDIGMAVNVSAVQLRGSTFVEDVAAVLADTSIDPARVTVELTETVSAVEGHGEIAALDALRSMGCRVAFDDFGTGYSSLSGLAELPIDVVKLDRAFVTELPDSQPARAIVEALVQMACALSLDVVIEGVETLGQLQALRDLGCRHIQGFALSRPRSVTEITELLEHQHPG